MKKRRAQASMEYLLVMGFVLLMLVPIAIVFYEQNREMNTQSNEQQAYLIARKIVEKGEEMYYLGEPSQTTLRVYFPENMNNVTIWNGSVVFELTRGSTFLDVAAHSWSVNISGNLSVRPGSHCVQIRAVPNGVYVNDTC